MNISYKSTHLIYLAGSDVGVDAATYSDGDLVGGLLTLTRALGPSRRGYLQAVTVHDTAGQTAALDVIIFNKNPSNTTFTDDAALDVADADLVKIVGIVKIGTTDYISLSTNSVGQSSNWAIPLVSEVTDSSQGTAGGGTLYACFRSNGATPTYTANSLSATFHFRWDPIA